MSISKRRWLRATIVISVAVVAAGWLALARRQSPGVSASTSVPVSSEVDLLGVPESERRLRHSSIEEVLQIARDALAKMSVTCDDYTARFVKQEAVSSGRLSEPTEMHVKVQTRLRNETEDAPKRVYLNFTKPDNVNGREVIWAADLHDGKMVVHEAGLLGLMTLRLDPEGILAMQGQRYPISEIGVVRLVEKLIERGEADRDNPEIKVTILRDHPFDEIAADLIQIRRQQPSDSEDDFSLAEIVFDPERMLILSYRSFGWPEQADASPPLQESYSYHDLVTNVGLREADFDPANPIYKFP